MAVSRSFAQFERRMKARAKEIRKSSERAVRAVVGRAGSTIPNITPVDTGNARRNYELFFGPGPTTVDPKRDKPTDPALLAVLRSGSGTAGSVSQERISKKLKEWGFGKGEVLSIVNQTPYIDRLEHGSSSQAPNGMLKRTVLVAQDEARKQKVTLRRE